MGYSVYVEIPNKEKKDKIFRLLERELKDFNELMKEEIVDDTAFCLSDDLSYSDKKHNPIVGFDYQSWIHPCERYYIDAICSWIALQVSKHNPYYIYDGIEVVLVENTDVNGYKSMSDKYFIDLKDHSYTLSKFNLLLKNELERLSRVFEREEFLNKLIK